MRSTPDAPRSPLRRLGRIRSRWTALVTATLLVAGAMVALSPAPRAAAEAPCTGNAIVCENQLPGTSPDIWDVDGAGDDDIQGFATSISVNLGQTVQFKIDTDARAYRIEIYRLGYYQGNGARKQADVTPSATLPQVQPACATDATTEIYDCGTWGVSASWAVPSTAVSGVYIARLIRTDNGDSSHIPFIVRDDSSHSQVVFQTSDPTWQAYNTYGQSDFYQGLANGRAYKVSYNRPITTRGDNAGRDSLFSNEYPMIRFMEQNGYDVSYISGLDSDVNGGLLTNHKVFVDAGHDEYWSAGQRANVEAARDAGVSLAFFSGNEVYWKTRWEASQDGTNTANRTLVCYKDTWANAAIDPLGPTATWRDPRFGGNGEGPENSLTGTMYMSNFTDLAITVSATEGKTRLWRNTSLTNQAAGTSTALLAHTIGYESDEDLDNGHRPAGLIDLSTTVGQTPQYLQDFGSTVAPGTTTHHVTLYRAPSGALVFGAGTIQWAWGVDSEHDGTAAPADPRIRQATANIFADMGAVATTPASDLVPATKSTDTTPPVAVITSPAANSASQEGSLITVTGTASDTGGGVVGGVEVSVDGGSSWHPATVTTSGANKAFTYSGVLTGTGAGAVQARATDDSGNIQSPVASLPLQVTCPCSIFGAATPGTLATTDASSLTLGVKFKSSTDGFISGIRFYKGAGNTGIHIGTLYDSAGTVLSTVTFTGETATGWQTANFARAVPVTAGTTYVAAYTAPSGHYSADGYYFISSGHTAGAVTALGGAANQDNGVYGTDNQFPTRSFQNTNYYVDVVFSTIDSTPLSAVATTPVPGSSSVLTSTTASAAFSRPVTPSTINMTVADAGNVVVPGSVTYDAAGKTVTFNPTHPLDVSTTYTVRLTASSPDVGAMAAPLSWTFTTVAADASPGVCPCSLFPETSSPVSGPQSDRAVQLGVAFTSDLNGTITGIRFYKGQTNSGPHTVSLYSSSGTQLGTATTSTETTSGWQVATFSTPITISRSAVYIASYLNSAGQYSYTAGDLANPVNATPLHTVANGGRYSYSGAPTTTSSANYFVDPVFVPAPDAAPEVASIDPSEGSTSVPVSSWITASFVNQIQASSATITVVADDGTAIPGSVASESLGASAIFVASVPFAPATHYTVTVSGAKSAAGTPMVGSFVSHFTTSGTAACPCSVFASNAQPAVSDSGDTGGITVGLKFTPSVSGSVTGIRYYRDAANTGVHTGTLYSADGTALTSLTFPSTTATGWQTATFASPVVVAANTTYVAAAYMPVGHYSVTSSFFGSPYVNTPLTGVNGVYTYGSDTFPVSSYNNGNYWVDVTFSADSSPAPSLSLVAQNPGPGDSGVSTSIAPSGTFNAAIDPASLQMSVTGPNGAAVAGTAAYAVSSSTATFTPSAPLANGSTYTVSLRAVASSGATMAAPATWSFTTTAPAAPSLSQPSPAAGSSGVSPAATPSAKFAAPVNPSTLIFKLTGPGVTAVPGVASYDPATQLATFTPSAPLASGTLYTATITASSIAGIPIAVPFSWTFTTSVPPAPTVSAQNPVPGATGVQPGTAVAATFSASIVASTLSFTVAGPNGAVLPGAVSYNALTNVATFQPTAALATSTLYSVSISATGTNGGVMAAPVTWSFTTTAAPAPVVGGKTPADGATGVLVTAVVTGTFSLPINTATGTFTLTGPAGAVAGSSSYNATTRVATFDPTASLAYGTTYTAALRATGTNGSAMASAATWSFTTVPAGVPAVSGQTPANAATGVALGVSPTGTFSIPITTSTLAFTLAGPGGVAVAGSTSFNSTTRVATFNPTSDLAYGTVYTASLKATGSTGGLMAAPATWTFTTVLAPAATVSGQSPAAGATGIASTSAVAGTFNTTMNASTIVLTVTPAGGTPVAGVVAYNATTRKATFTPSAPLAFGTVFTASLSGVTSLGGVMVAPATWTFTTMPAFTLNSLFQPTEAPSSSPTSSSAVTTLGLSFYSDKAGSVTAIEFYAQAGNTGPQPVALWSSNGTKLGSGTATTTVAGWNTVPLTTPVAITAGTTYVASYTAPNGHYSTSSFGFLFTKNNGIMHARSGAGRLQAGTNFPSSTNSNNYWVDAVVSIPGQ